MAAAAGSDDVVLFSRHGATAPNLAGLRCGGDLDVPLADAGRAQAHALARQVGALASPVGVIVTSALIRTRETAAIVAAGLGGVQVVVEPLLAERRLGLWNLKPIATTQPWFDAGMVPPGGESNDVFSARIRDGLDRLRRWLPRRPLVIGSRGVARVIGEITGTPGIGAVRNGELIVIPLSGAVPSAGLEGRKCPV